MTPDFKMIRTGAGAAPAILLLGMLPVFGAAQIDSGDSRAGAEITLEEIVVTARKRTEDLQSTPISIRAFSGEDLEARGVDRMDDLANYVPNMTFQNSPGHSGSNSAAAVYVRGIGQQDFVPTVDPGVGIYIDGVYVARSLGAVLDVLDIERIEVLRGPQGTLFGRNTTGGAVNIITQAPGDALTGRVDVKLGSDERQDVRLSGNLPLSDNSGVRFSVARLSQDGYVHRMADDVSLGDDDTLTGRLRFYGELTDRLSLDFSVDFSRDRENGPPMELTAIGYGSFFYNPVDANGNFDPAAIGRQIAALGINSLTPVDNFALLHNWIQAIVLPQFGITSGADCLTQIPGQPFSGAGNPGNPACYNAQYIFGDGRDAGTAPTVSDLETAGYALTATWDVNDALQVKSITSIRTLEGEFSRDGDHSPLPIVLLTDTYEQDQFAQELQLLGTGLSDRLNWIVGLYLFSEDGLNVNDVFFPPADVRSGGEFDNESNAVFAQASYDLSDRWRATLGLRYTDEKKSFSPDQYILADRTAVDTDGDNVPDSPAFGVGARVLPFVTEEFEITETTPLLNVSYHATDDLMLYATWSEGFKSGGFTQRVFPPLTIVPTFDPEFVTSYEFGWKFTGLGNRLRLNGALFTTDYKDIQVSIFDPSGGNTAPIFRNAAEAGIDGMEVELSLLATNGIYVEAGLGWLDPAFEAVDERADEITLDSKFERVSEWTGFLSVARDFATPMGTFTPRLDYSFRSDYFNDALNTPDIAQADSVTLINLSLAWQSPGQRWSALLACTNIGDEQYVVAGLHNTTFDIRERIHHRGRECYATGSFRFGAVASR